VRCHPVNHRTGNQRLADSHIPAPTRPVLIQVPDGCCQVMIGIHQTHASSHNAVPVIVSVVAKGYVILVFHPHQTGHGIRRRTIHPDFPVMIQRHKCKSRIYPGVHHVQVEPIMFRNQPPESHPRAAHRVNANLQSRGCHRAQIYHIFQVYHIRSDVIIKMGCGCLQRFFQRGAFYRLQPAS